MPLLDILAFRTLSNLQAPRVVAGAPASLRDSHISKTSLFSMAYECHVSESLHGMRIGNNCMKRLNFFGLRLKPCE